MGYKRDESRLRAFVVRLTLVVLGVLFALVSLEAILQAGALYVRLTSGGEVKERWLAGGLRVLCLGDSNTYGLWLSDRSQAYPQQLEALWNETVRAPRVEVLNLGYPGTNSSRLRKLFVPMLETLLPDVVIVMIGANDQWTVPVPIDDEEESSRWFRNAIARRSRLYELVYMIRRARRAAAPLEIETHLDDRGGATATARYGDREFSLGWKRASLFDPEFKTKLETNLRFFVDVARRRSVKLVFMTYPSLKWNYGEAGAITRSVAAETGTHLIDLAATFKDICPAEPCEKWLLRDHHPTADGYQRVAETVVRELRSEL